MVKRNNYFLIIVIALVVIGFVFFMGQGKGVGITKPSTDVQNKGVQLKVLFDDGTGNFVEFDKLPKVNLQSLVSYTGGNPYVTTPRIKQHYHKNHNK